MNAAVKFAKLHSNALLSAGVVVGIVFSNIMSAKAGAKSARMIDDEERRLGRALTRKEKFRVCWKNYILSTGTQILTVTGVVGNGYLNMKSNAALLSAYSISQSQLQKLQDKTKEIVGNQKATKIKDEVNKEIIEERKDDKIENTNVIGAKDNITFIDDISQRKFMSNWIEVDQAIIRLNKIINSKECFISLNDLYYELHLKPLNDCLGENFGWGRGTYETYLIEIRHSTANDEYDNPCAVIEFINKPKLLSEIK